MAYRTIEAQPIAGALGAEISGVDLTRPLSNAETADVRQALRDHKVIFFRDQELTPEDHLRASGVFGTIFRVPFVQSRDGYPDIIDIVKEPADAGKFNFGGAWHTDASFEEAPPLGSALYALETPPYGGDTLWTNMEAAYAALSDGMRAMLAGLRAVHSAQRYYGVGGHFNSDDKKSVSMTINPSEAGDERVVHPVVRTHPETGAKSLYVNPVYTICFEDMTEEESAPLLGFLFEHAIRPEFQCRFNWTPRTLAVWDNRATMHFAINDYDGHRRHMNRVTIAGDKPR
ncbi:MAG: TauD/TfdA family dioxygenase [Magnetovibrio sp.]|nr:TauD/TfdA family dioxygenase [Magnetovibrio sp.]